MAQSYPRKLTPIVIVAVLILIQGILYLSASVWSILVYKCRSTSNTQLGKVMQFIYFRDKACGEISWIKSSSSSSSSLLSSFDTTTISHYDIFNGDYNDDAIIQSPAATIPDMPDITLVAFRTNILCFVYGIISGLWILTTLMVLVSSCCSNAGRKTYHLCYTPWMIVVTLGCILDVVATGFHIYDIYYTTSAEKTLEYLNVKNISEMMKEIKTFSKLFTYSAIILTCISSRLIVFWLFNIFGVFLASRQAKKFLCNKSNSENSFYEQQTLPSHKDMPYDHREFSSKEPSITCSSSSPLSSNIRGERKTFEPFKPTPSAYDNKYLHQDDGGFSESRQRYDAGKRRVDELSRYDDTSPIAYRRYQHHHLAQPPSDHRLSLNAEPDRQRELFIPPIGYRLSLQNNAPSKDRIDKRHSHGVENVHITDELRGQLPWSYFSARDDIATAKRALAHTDEHEIMPPVPVPDYTYHFPRKERPSIKSGNGREGGDGGSGIDSEHHSQMTSSTRKSTRPQSPNTRW